MHSWKPLQSWLWIQPQHWCQDYWGENLLEMLGGGFEIQIIAFWSLYAKSKSTLRKTASVPSNQCDVENLNICRYIALHALLGKTPSAGAGNPLLPSCEPIRRPLPSHRPRLVSLGALANNVQTHQAAHLYTFFLDLTNLLNLSTGLGVKERTIFMNRRKKHCQRHSGPKVKCSHQSNSY